MPGPHSLPATRYSRPVVFCDFDGTITRCDVTDLVLSQLAHPSWREAEQEWMRGLIGSRECLERQMALVKASVGELDALIDSVEVDPGFLSFHQSIRRRAIPFYVMSDGFDYIARRVLKRAGLNGRLRDGARLYASVLRIKGRRARTEFPYAVSACDHGCATCKPAIMRRLSRGRHPVIFIGDGLSDRFAVEEADQVFARAPLFAFCREKGIPCQPFESFADIESALDRLIGKGMRPRACISR